MSVFKVILTILLNVFILFLFFVFCFHFYAQIVLQDVTRQAARYSITRGRMGDLWFDPRAEQDDGRTIGTIFRSLNIRVGDTVGTVDLDQPYHQAFCSDTCQANAIDYYRNLYLAGIEQNNVNNFPVHVWDAIGLANRLALAQLGGAVSQYPCFFPGILNENTFGLPDGQDTNGCLLCFARPAQQGCDANAFGGDSIVVSCIFNSGNAITNFVRNLGDFFGADVRGLGILQAEFWAFYPSSLTNPCLWPGCS